MSSKKYQSDVVQDGALWTASITRQVTSVKSIVSKQQDGFASEAEAQAWVDTHLAEFISTQKNANSRQGSSRKDQEEMKRLRSSRRAEKTEAAKREKEELALANDADKKPLDSAAEHEPDFGSEFDSYDD
jgi:hypothetical protein